jgi:hypothetical protein
MPEAALQIVFHSAAVTVRSPPSVTILLSGPLVSLGQERRKATSASPWRSSVQPGISLYEIGAMRTLLSAALPLVPAQADSRPAAASNTPPARTLRRILILPPP